MSERREPTINMTRPAMDEATKSAPPNASSASPRDSTNAGKTQPPSTQRVSGKPRPSTQRPIVKQVVVKSKVAPLALVLAFAGLGAAGFIYWQLTQTQQMLVVSQARIAQLEGKFELTDDEANSSNATIQAKLKEANSEIRKLWGVSYDTNRKAIEANTAKLKSVEKLAKSAGSKVGKQLAGVDKKIVAIDKKLQADLKNTVADLSVVNELLEAQQGAITSAEDGNLQTANRLRAVSDKLVIIERAESELQQQLAINTEAIEAIDAFRRTVNRQLLQQKNTGPATP